MSGSIPTTMRAAAISRFGGADEIRTTQLPVPAAGPGEVLIRVETADIAVWDPEERQGHLVELMRQMGNEPKFPYVLGTDGAGTIAAVGDGVTNVKPGDTVYGMEFLNPRGGFYAEYCVVHADHVAPVPANLSIEHAGAMGGDALTAMMGLDDTLGLKRGESVMIFGASGGIGHLAVQLAKSMGLRVFAVASGEDGTTLARRLKADVAIDGRKEDVLAAATAFAPQGIDAALFTAGGPAAEHAAGAVKSGGRIAHPEGVEPLKERPGIMVKMYSGIPSRDAIERLNRLIEAGPFHVEIARVFSLDQAADAHRAMGEHYLGKFAMRVA